MFHIKICGVTSPEDALLVAKAGADAIGINFYEKSPRYVRPDQAAAIVNRLREDFPADHVQVFGVFVNSTLDDILWTIRDANLYGPDRGFGIQLHGDEPPEFIRDLHQQGLGTTGSLLHASGHVATVPIVRALRCTGGEFAIAASYLQSCQQLGCLPQAVLLDAFAPNTYGGTGTRLDWNVFRDNRAKFHGLPLVLAGGLTPENVAEAITTAHPDAVDVASGVESAPGKKDPAKLRAFIAAAKQAFAQTIPKHKRV
jgi:phosphoribosylanthranilate isomerase